MRHVRFFVAASMLIVGCSSMAFAQESAPTDEQIQQAAEQQDSATFEEEITVTGTLIPRPTLDSF